MNLLILAGGFGTRLKIQVPNLPKALAPIGGIPFLQFQLTNWIEQGLSEFTFLLHHQANQIVDFLQKNQTGFLKDCTVTWITEPTPKDTGGAVAHAVKEMDLSGDFLLTNADTWLGGGVIELLKAPSPTMAVLKMEDVSRYGQVYFDGEAHVTSFSEKKNTNESGWINAGFYRLNCGLFKDWDGEPFSLERKFFVELVQSRSLMAISLKTEFIDIGLPDDYHRFCRWIASDRQVAL